MRGPTSAIEARLDMDTTVGGFDPRQRLSITERDGVIAVLAHKAFIRRLDARRGV